VSVTFERTESHLSWGRVVRAAHDVARPRFQDELGAVVAKTATRPGRALAVGLGRSYGDSSLNPGGAVIAMSSLDRIDSFNCTTGVVRADAGVSLDTLIRVGLPRGFFPPVVPGTRFITLGGAIANDVHGKNHHRAGTLGNHVRRLALRRTNGDVHELYPNHPSGLFEATLGGLGLTGIIEWAEIALNRVPSSAIDAETIAFDSLSDFFALARESEPSHEYTVAWIDCTGLGRSLGRGIFTRGNHASEPSADVRQARGRVPCCAIPFECPAFTLGPLTLKVLNNAYFAMNKARAGKRRVDYGSFFFPLDGIAHWNRLYGRPGMYQYQCLVPPGTAPDAVAELLSQIAKCGEGSILAVLKTFGDQPSLGLLSFARPGTTLALDFRNRGQSTLTLLARLDAVVREVGGRLYPAKDGRIPAAMFAASFPRLSEFIPHVDPGLSSAFWRRVKP
jgi:FAD/FMN-containing dehydrogenase